LGIVRGREDLCNVRWWRRRLGWSVSGDGGCMLMVSVCGGSWEMVKTRIGLDCDRFKLGTVEEGRICALLCGGDEYWAGV